MRKIAAGEMAMGDVMQIAMKSGPGESLRWDLDRIGTTWHPTAAELEVMQRRFDHRIGVGAPAAVPEGKTFQKFVGDIGERCAVTLLGCLFPDADIENANSRRMNTAGYDVVVGRKASVRLSVKALSQVDGFGWLQSQSEKSLQFDHVLHMNFGCMLTPKGARLRHGIEVKSRPDVYVIPRDVVMKWLDQRHYALNKSKWIYCYNFRPSVAEQRHETPDLRDWENRFDIIEQAIG